MSSQQQHCIGYQYYIEVRASEIVLFHKHRREFIVSKRVGFPIAMEIMHTSGIGEDIGLTVVKNGSGLGDEAREGFDEVNMAFNLQERRELQGWQQIRTT